MSSSEAGGSRDGYKEVQLGPKTLEVPEEWDIQKFGDVFEKRREKIEVADETESVKYVGLDDIEGGNIHLQDFDKNGTERSSTRGFRRGDVLFGKLRPYLNKAAIAPFDGICSSDIIPIYATDKAEDDYLIYLIHSNIVRDRATSTMSGTNLPRTSWSDLASGQVPLPPLPEQRRIADILSTADEKIQQTEEIIEVTNELREGLVQDLVFYGSSHGDTQTVQLGPFSTEISDSWDVATIGDVSRIIQYGSSTSLSQEGRYPIFRMNNIELGQMVASPMKYVDLDPSEAEKYLVERGDILLNRTNSIDLVGKTGIFDLDGEFVFASYLIRIRTTDEMNPWFLNYYLNSKTGQDILFSYATRGASQANINASSIKSVKVPVPPRQEQDEIVNRIQMVEEKIDREQETKARLQELKRGLMQDLLTGQVRVTPDD